MCYYAKHNIIIIITITSLLFVDGILFFVIVKGVRVGYLITQLCCWGHLFPRKH